MNKKKSVSGIFFSMFLRTVVIILAIVIVAMGVVLVKQKLNRKNTDRAGDSEVDESILTEEDGQDELLGSPEDNTGGEEGTVQQNTSIDKKIVVLNGTDTKGLAGHWRDTLASYGYQNLDAKNYYSRLEQTKVLAAEDGVGTDLLQYFPNADYQVGTLTSDDTDANVDGVDIFVIIGTSDDVLSQQ